MLLGKCKTVLFERDQSFIVIQEAKVIKRKTDVADALLEKSFEDDMC